MLGIYAESEKAKALDAGEDVIGGLGPAERLWIGLGDVDVGVDGCFEFGNRTEHAAPESARCEKREEAFDLIDP